MNANELADKLEKFYKGMIIDKSITMLRQQQAELDRAVELYTDKAIENEALKAELNKWMNGDYVMSAGELEK